MTFFCTPRDAGVVKDARFWVGSITSRCSGKWARTHPLFSGGIKDRTRETAEIEPRFWVTSNKPPIAKSNQFLHRWRPLIMWVRHHGIMKSLGHKRKLICLICFSSSKRVLLPLWCSKLLSAIFKATETLSSAPVILRVRHHGIMKSLSHRRKLMFNMSDMF